MGNSSILLLFEFLCIEAPYGQFVISRFFSSWRRSKRQASQLEMKGFLVVVVGLSFAIARHPETVLLGGMNDLA